MDQAENLRRLIKKNIISKEHLARVITVTSGKGGVGKSSTAVNLAIHLSRLGNRVIIIDADFGLANIEVMLGIRPKYTLADVMFRGKNLDEVVTRGPEDIGFLSGGSGIKELSNMNKEQVMDFITKLYELDRMADIIIIDTGAGISDSVMELVVASREILLVATPEPTSITDAYALLKMLNRRGGFDQSNVSIKMIGNRINRYEDGIELFEKLSVVVKKFLGIEFSLLGLVPYDDKCQKSVMKQSPVSLEYPNAAATKAYENIAYKLNFASEGSDEAKKTRGIRTLFSNVVKMKYRK